MYVYSELNVAKLKLNPLSTHLLATQRFTNDLVLWGQSDEKLHLDVTVSSQHS